MIICKWKEIPNVSLPLFIKRDDTYESPKKLLSVTLFLAIALASSAFPVYASPLQETLPTNLDTQDMNELTARLAVSTYFAERLDFLTGDSEGIISAVEPIMNDEFLHKDALINNNIHYISFVLTFIDINCWDDMAEVSVEETVIYTENSVQKKIAPLHIKFFYASTPQEMLSLFLTDMSIQSSTLNQPPIFRRPQTHLIL